MNTMIKCIMTVLFIALNACTEGGGGQSASSLNALDAENASCKNAVQPTSTAPSMNPSQLAFKAGMAWRLQKLQVYQDIRSKKDSNFAFIGYTITDFNLSPEVHRDCGGMTSDGNVNFSFSVRTVFRGKNRDILSKMEGTLSGDPRKNLQLKSNIISVKNETFFGSGAQTSGDVQFRYISESRFELIESAFGESSNSTTNVRYVSTYAMAEIKELELHKEAYDYAILASYSGGMGLSAKESLDFADQVVSMGIARGSNYLDSYREAFTFAMKPSYQDGLNYDHQTKSKARSFANAIASLQDAAEVFQHFRELYIYAKKPVYSGGLGMSLEDAVDYATQKTGLQF